MRWRGRRQSENIEDRRGMGGRIALGGGLGGIALLLLALLFGADPRELLEQLPANGGSPGTQTSRPTNPEEEELKQFVAVVLAETEDVWSELFGKIGRRYRQNEWFQVTLSSIGDAVIATDDQGHVTFMNAVAESLTGWKEQSAGGQPLERVFQIVNEETRRSVDNPALRAIREKVIVGLANHTVLLSRDGRETFTSERDRRLGPDAPYREARRG